MQMASTWLWRVKRKLSTDSKTQITTTMDYGAGKEISLAIASSSRVRAFPILEISLHVNRSILRNQNWRKAGERSRHYRDEALRRKKAKLNRLKRSLSIQPACSFQHISSTWFLTTTTMTYEKASVTRRNSSTCAHKKNSSTCKTWALRSTRKWSTEWETERLSAQTLNHFNLSHKCSLYLSLFWQTKNYVNESKGKSFSTASIANFHDPIY